MTSYTIEMTGHEKLNQFGSAMTNIVAQTMKQVANTNGKALFNDINNATRVKTGRLKRGNMLEMSATGFVYWNNVPYAKHMDTGPRGNKFVTNAWNKHKTKIIQDTNVIFTNQLKSFFGRG
jgi:hypothetical protein